MYLLRLSRLSEKIKRNQLVKGVVFSDLHFCKNCQHSYLTLSRQILLLLTPDNPRAFISSSYLLNMFPH